MRFHEITDIAFSKDRLKITIDGKPYSLALSEISERLWRATELERRNFVISPSGYGIHWPLLDEDLSIDGLLGIKHAPPADKDMAAVSKKH